MHPFHLAIPVNDLDAARQFYGGLLGCKEGRSAPRWIDFDFFGHQISLHLIDGAGIAGNNPVDGDHVPIPHFGVILDIESWENLARHLTESHIQFIVEPRYRFQGLVGEQATMFFKDPSGNALEFKAFKDPSLIFADQ